MEHLPLPRDPRPKPQRVRFLCRALPYDEGDFATYPTRVDWPNLLPQGDRLPVWLVPDAVAVDEEQKEHQEEVLQSWLFFGLLHAVLSPFGLYNAADYIDGDFIHTRNLLERASQWHEAIRLQPKKEVYLETARHNYTLAVQTAIALENESFKHIDRMLKLSINALYTTVEGMILRAIDGQIWALTPHHNARFDEHMRRDLQSNGWCPYDIAHVEYQEGSSVSALWFLQHMRKTDPPEWHADCSSEICQRMQIDMDVYQPMHINATCTCDCLGPSQEDVLQCLDKGDYPVIELKAETQADLALAVHAYQDLPDDTTYIALSHVWADGLGNPRATALPRCQLIRIRALIEGIMERRSTYKHGSASEPFLHKTKLLLWCDTLCCPVELKGKLQALEKIRAVYLSAAYVLVLDRDLQRHNFADLSLAEVAWRILISGYMRRLWTYQEAGLAPKLLVQFADGPYDIMPIITQTSEQYNASPIRDRLYLHASAGLANIRTWMRSDRKMWVREAITGVSHRSVSVPTDEPLCLATVLGLDSQELAQTIPEERMAVLWQKLAKHEHGISGEAIFNTLPRLQFSGLAWAPRSILQPVQQQTDVLELDSVRKPAILYKHGLRVQAPGWRLRCEGLPGALPDSFWPDVKSMRVLTPVKHNDCHYNIVQMPKQGLASPDVNLLELVQDTTKEWYLILHRDEFCFDYKIWTSQRKAILASKERSEYGLPFYKSRMLVVVDRLAPTSELVRKVDSIWGGRIRQSWMIKLLTMVVTFENVVSLLLKPLPEAVAIGVVRLLERPLQWSGMTLGMKIRKMMHATKIEAPKTPEAAKLLEQAANPEAHDKIGESIIFAVMGRYVNVVQTFDSTTEWVVD